MNTGINDDNFLQKLFINEVKNAPYRFVGTGETPNTIILEDESGHQVVAVLVDQEVVIDATSDDIREGKIAVTDEGVTVGDKYIPSYQTVREIRVIPAGSKVQTQKMPRDDSYDYTEFQAVICPFNSSLSNSVGAEFVAFGDNVYKVRDTASQSEIYKDSENKIIDLGITNDLGVPCILRYITYKEVE